MGWEIKKSWVETVLGKDVNVTIKGIASHYVAIVEWVEDKINEYGFSPNGQITLTGFAGVELAEGGVREVFSRAARYGVLESGRGLGQ